MRLAQLLEGLSFKLPDTFSAQTEKIGNFLQGMRMVCYETISQA
jgi:hypothetical protein